jgi:hypothetical protein
VVLALVLLAELAARAVLVEVVVNNQALVAQALLGKEITVEAAASQTAAQLAVEAAVLVLSALPHLGRPYQQAGRVQHLQFLALA